MYTLPEGGVIGLKLTLNIGKKDIKALALIGKIGLYMWFYLFCLGVVNMGLFFLSLFCWVIFVCSLRISWEFSWDPPKKRGE